MKIKRINFYEAHDRWTGQLVRDIPSDMLRFDLAFVLPKPSVLGDGYAGADGCVVAFPMLVGKSGTFGGSSTCGRWSSFGICLAELPDDDPRVAGAAETFGSDCWTTYRHPKNANGGRDFSQRVPVQIREFIAAKDINEV